MQTFLIQVANGKKELITVNKSVHNLNIIYMTSKSSDRDEV